MYVLTLIAFALLASLLSGAWFSWAKASHTTETYTRKYAPWRKHCELAALILAILASVLYLISWLSWFHNGGSPHGMTPPLGIWKPVGQASYCALIATLVLALFATGKRRWLLVSWAVAFVIVEVLLSIAEMD
jgi:hypothetical protein